jgi:hypothetical protein
VQRARQLPFEDQILTGDDVALDDETRSQAARAIALDGGTSSALNTTVHFTP